MTDPRETLARIRKRADAATPGPWGADGHVIDAQTGPGNCPGCSGIPSPAHEPACLYSEIAGAGEQDAEFIAAARTDVPALLDALEKVLELHQPVTDGMGFTEDGYGGISPACSSCGTSDEYAVPYPCPTVTAITTALEATK